MKQYILFGLTILAVAAGAQYSRVKALAPYSNDAIHEWACDTVIKQWPNDGGCYDVCESRAIHATLSNVTPADSFNNEGEPYPIGVPITWHPDLTNACAIVLEGAEW